MSELLHIACPRGHCATLAHDRSFVLSTPGSDPSTAVSLSMPHRAMPYESAQLHAIFQMNLPEGRLLEEITRRLAKTVSIDPMLLLAITGNSAPIGRLTCHLPGQVQQDGAVGESLAEILAWDGAQDLFKQLFDRYVMRSGISGVQPKVIVPVRTEAGVDASLRRTTTATEELIIKSGQQEYPHLAINEFVCMSIAKEAGIATPDFFLSKNLQMFIMRRFDRLGDAGPLGFEDLAALMNKAPRQKYDGSYEQAARAIQFFASPQHTQASLEQFFQTVVLSCMLGNGDAHLKNFGLLYTDPGADDVRISPAFDLVCTTMYLPDDTLALSLGGSKSLFAAPAHLQKLADLCHVREVRRVVDRLLEAAAAVLYLQDELLRQAPGLREAIEHQMSFFEQRTGATHRQQAGG